MTNPSSRVSYILTTRNRAAYLAKALDNVREFITSQDELIVIDAASTDNTREVIAANHDIVAQFLSEPDAGEAHGLNKAILLSNGIYLKFLSDDDYILPDSMRQVIALLEDHQEIDALLCGGEAHEGDPATGETRFVRNIYVSQEKRLTDDIWNLLNTPLQCLIMKRSLIARVGLFDPSFRAIDADFMPRLIRAKADFRYAHINLLRWIVWPHSGMRNADERACDTARVFLTGRQWEHVGFINSDPLSKALGLNDLPHGREVVDIMLLSERIRRKGFGAILKPLALLGNGTHAAVQVLRKLLHKKNGTTNKHQASVIWDGSLR